MSVLTEAGPPQYNLKVCRGDTFLRTMSFVDSDGVAINITGWTIFFTIKDVKEEADGSAEISKTITVHTNAAAGLSQILVAASEMAALNGDYFYDIQIKKSDDTVLTILRGKFIVDSDITLRTS